MVKMERMKLTQGTLDQLFHCLQNLKILFTTHGEQSIFHSQQDNRNNSNQS